MIHTSSEMFSEDGHRISFFNDSFGGFYSKKSNGHLGYEFICYIKGKKYIAEPELSGGVIIREWNENR
jgi:hypothetical protein